MKKICSIIYNPNSSGIKGTKVIDEMCKIIGENYIVKTYKSDGPGFGTKYIKEANRDSDLVISVGGDGTFDEIIRGIYDENQKAIISHIPMGTTNDLGKTFNLIGNPIESLKKILLGRETTIDILTINDIPYAYVAAFGYLTCIANDTPENLKKALGKSAYVLYCGTQSLRKPEVYNLEYEIDGELYQTDCILGAISNSKGFAGFEFYNDFKLNDGKFEVMFVPNMPKLEMLQHLKSIVLNKKTIEDNPSIVLHKNVSCIKIKFDKIPVDNWSLDGDKQSLPKEVEIKVGKQIRVLLPDDVVDKLCN